MNNNNLKTNRVARISSCFFLVTILCVLVSLTYIQFSSEFSAYFKSVSDQERFSRVMRYFLGVVACVNIIGLSLSIFNESRNRIKFSMQANGYERQLIGLQKQAITDPLTGLYNRRYLELILKGYLIEYNKIEAELGLLVLDFDHFKHVNDTYGHLVGDRVLVTVADLLKRNSRSDDIIARLGGEEFAIIVPNVTNDQLTGIAERYRELIKSVKVRHDNVIIRPTVSIGIAINNSTNTSVAEFLNIADKKMYEAKRNGRNRIAA